MPREPWCESGTNPSPQPPPTRGGGAILQHCCVGWRYIAIGRVSVIIVPGAPSAWLAYVEVADIAAATQKARSLGATIMQDVTEVMGMGSFSILVDPTGAALGLWQTKT